MNSTRRTRCPIGTVWARQNYEVRPDCHQVYFSGRSVGAPGRRGRLRVPVFWFNIQHYRMCHGCAQTLTHNTRCILPIIQQDESRLKQRWGKSDWIYVTHKCKNMYRVHHHWGLALQCDWWLLHWKWRLVEVIWGWENYGQVAYSSTARKTANDNGEDNAVLLGIVALMVKAGVWLVALMVKAAVWLVTVVLKVEAAWFTYLLAYYLQI